MGAAKFVGASALYSRASFFHNGPVQYHRRSWLFRFAFVSEGFVSLPKLAGASFTMLAHAFLLAYGDGQAKIIALEKGAASKIILDLRRYAQSFSTLIPKVVQIKIRSKPIGIPFTMLAFNGLALVFDAILRGRYVHGPFIVSQILLGLFVTSGTLSFAAADFVRKQRTADILTKIAPSLLFLASLANFMLAVVSLNPFIIMAVIAFAVSNFVGFFVRIDKEQGQHLHS